VPHHNKDMQNHKYRVGQSVVSPSGEYEILRLLPPSGDEFQYRIKSKFETYERVIGEELLTSRIAPTF
jgi:hypothetical protein